MRFGWRVTSYYFIGNNNYESAGLSFDIEAIRTAPKTIIDNTLHNTLQSGKAFER